ncbi:MAG: hypothetical protein JOY59_07320, partial [Candidatus Eremiobacteraeota bacterium]|nr:hypothetical protein [Candidatus Eremiobacteraeota bacterium]
MPTVFRAEFMRRVRSRPYLLGTLVGVLAVALLIKLPSMLERSLGSATKSLIVAGEPALRATAIPLLRRDPEVTVGDEVDRLPSPMTVAFLEAHHASAALLLVRERRGLRAVAYARDPGNFPSRRIQSALLPLGLALATGISTERVAGFEGMDFAVRGVESRYSTEARADLARALAYGLVFILYIAIVFNGQAIMSAVAEEKTSRIAELLVAT